MLTLVTQAGGISELIYRQHIYTLLIPAFGRLRQEDHKSEAELYSQPDLHSKSFSQKPKK
jgi:hypothetical protein